MRCLLVRAIPRSQAGGLGPQWNTAKSSHLFLVDVAGKQRTQASHWCFCFYVSGACEVEKFIPGATTNLSTFRQNVSLQSPFPQSWAWPSPGISPFSLRVPNLAASDLPCTQPALSNISRLRETITDPGASQQLFISSVILIRLWHRVFHSPKHTICLVPARLVQRPAPYLRTISPSSGCPYLAGRSTPIDSLGI